MAALPDYEIVTTPFERARILVDGGAPGAAWGLIESEIAPGVGTPPHVHRREDEAFYILDGNVEFYMGGTRVRAVKDDFVFAPRNIPHNFMNVGADPLRMLIWYSPGAFGEMFRRMARIEGPPDPVALTQLCAEFGVEILPPFEPCEVIPSHAPLPAGCVGQRCGGGEFLDVLGEGTWVKAEGAQTGGAFALFELRSRPGGGTPPHVHTREDEYFYVLEGELTITLDGEPIQLRAGDFAFGPVRKPHYYTNHSKETARVLVWTVPSGFEYFFREAAQLAMPPQRGQVATLCRKYGMELLTA